MKLFLKNIFAVSVLSILLMGCNGETDQGAQELRNNDGTGENFQNVSFGPEDADQPETGQPNDNAQTDNEFPLFDGDTDRGSFQNRYNRGFRYHRDGNVQPNEGTDTPSPEQNQRMEEGNTDTQDDNQAGANASDIVKEVVRLTNEARKENGLPALKMDAQLNDIAQKKSVDMADNNYLSHTSPTYGSPFDMLKQFGVNYTTAAENIASGQETAQEVVNGWMNSEGHRKNILNDSVTHIGVGMEDSGNMGPYWTQMFIAK